MASRTIDEIDTIVIHCADTPNGSDRYTILDIDRWHRDRGFRRDAIVRSAFRPHLQSVGYHRVINVDGSVAKGRSIGEVGAHAKGANQTSVGICLLGTDAFTLPQWCALRETVTELRRLYEGITRVIGHRDVPGTLKSCPGFSVGEWIANSMDQLDGHVYGGWLQ